MKKIFSSELHAQLFTGLSCSSCVMKQRRRLTIDGLLRCWLHEGAARRQLCDGRGCHCAGQHLRGMRGWTQSITCKDGNQWQILTFRNWQESHQFMNRTTSSVIQVGWGWGRAVSPRWAWARSRASPAGCSCRSWWCPGWWRSAATGAAPDRERTCRTEPEGVRRAALGGRHPG